MAPLWLFQDLPHPPRWLALLCVWQWYRQCVGLLFVQETEEDLAIWWCQTSSSRQEMLLWGDGTVFGHWLVHPPTAVCPFPFPTLVFYCYYTNMHHAPFLKFKGSVTLATKPKQFERRAQQRLKLGVLVFSRKIKRAITPSSAVYVN